MNKPRVYEVAKQLNMDPKALVGLLQSMGVDGIRNHMSVVEHDDLERIKRHLDPHNPPAWARIAHAPPPPAYSAPEATLPERPVPTKKLAPTRHVAAAEPVTMISQKPLRPPDRTNEPRAGEMFGTEFLDNMAHQMIAPLQSIELHCTNMLDGLVPEGKRNQRLGEVIGHARVLAELARRLRFLHELVSGAEIGAEAGREVVSFKKVTTLWIDGFNNYLPQSQSTGIGVDINHPKMNDMPDVIASPLAVRQVVMNLYDNAFKYGREKGKIWINARVEHPFVVNEFSHLARVVLTDEAASHIFERGYRAPEARALRGSGTGVGMWISQQLMRAIRGDLCVNPTSQGITKFVLTWRLA